MTSRSDDIRLVFPASPEYVLLARLAVAGIGTRLGLGYDDLDDLRVAVGEVCQLLMGEDGRKGTVEMRFGVRPDRLVVEGVADTDPAPSRPDPEDLSLQLLAALVDEHQLVDDGEGFCVRLVKQLGA